MNADEMKSEIHIPNSDTIRVLLIEDNPGDSRLIREMIVDAGDSLVQLECVDRLGTGLERLAAGGIDGLLLDLSLPDSQGLETFHEAQAQPPEVAIIVLTGLDDEELALRAVREGAQDYLVKGEVDGNLLVRSIRYAIERKRIQEQLETANRVKTEFLSIMSHELRTPLGIIMNYTGMIQDKLIGEINQKQERAVGKIMNQSKELLVMINSILEATRMEAGRIRVEKHAVNLGTFLNELRLYYDVPLDKDITFTWDYPSDLPVISIDGGKLRYVLQNLIGNAVKFTEKGKVTLSAQYFPETKTVEFKVTDTGVGIPKEAFSVIFEKFRQLDSSRTRSYGGMGLGLFIVKEIAESLGGKVSVDSEPGKGSTFTVSLPGEGTLH